MQEKLCRKCKQTKTIDNFYKDESGKFGVKGQCKACRGDNHKNYYIKNIARIRKQQKGYYRKCIGKRKITIKKDGTFWCVLWGGDLVEGVAGYGVTIDKAMINFAKEILDPKGLYWQGLTTENKKGDE